MNGNGHHDAAAHSGASTHRSWIPAVAVSLLLHAAIFAALAVAWRHPTPPAPMKTGRSIAVTLGGGEVKREADARGAAPAVAGESKLAESREVHTQAPRRPPPTVVARAPPHTPPAAREEPARPEPAPAAPPNEANAGSGTPAEAVSVARADGASDERSAAGAGSGAEAGAAAGAGVALAERDRYIDRIRSHLAQVRCEQGYSLRARERDLEGELRVSLVIDPRGQPVERRVEQSSGSALLDRDALRVIDLCSPLPPPPPTPSGDLYELSFSLHMGLK